MRALLPVAWLAGLVHAQLTVYGATPVSGNNASSTTTTALPGESSTVTLIPPPPPGNLPASVGIAIDGTAPATQKPLVYGNFMGWSIELSVATQFLGIDPGHLQVPFLNYLASQSSRAHSNLLVRVGGNTQDSSTINVTQSASISKTYGSGAVNSDDGTPSVAFGPSLLHTMKNISGLVELDWVFGLQMLDESLVPTNTLTVAEYAESILADNLFTLQIGNEPDLYGQHGKRPANYSIPNYLADFGTEVMALNSSAGLVDKSKFSAPGVCCNWTPQQMLDAGLLSSFGTSLNNLNFQHYPNNNCAATGKTNSTVIVPQEIFPQYLSHYWVDQLTAPYSAASAAAVGAGLSLVMMETNTASCGGFPGVSDSFGAALWAVDYGLSLASLGFQHSLFHISGRSTYYNAFQPPPTNESLSRGWMTGPLYYSSLFLAEAFGSGVHAYDLGQNGANDTRPAYALFDSTGAPSRAILMNYVTDPTGASDYTANLALPNTPSSVTVKYLSSPSVAEHYNITWAGQSWGGYNSQGLPTGNVETVTIQCSTTCNIPVKAPSAALVFLSAQAAADGQVQAQATTSFATTAATRTVGTATVDSAVLETSNGNGGSGQVFGYSGTGKSNSASGLGVGARRVWMTAIALALVTGLLSY